MFIKSEWIKSLTIVLIAIVTYGGFLYVTDYVDHQKVFSEEVLSSVNATSMDEVEWIVVRKAKAIKNYTLVRNKNTKEIVKISHGHIRKADEVLFMPNFSNEKWISRE